MQVAGSGKSPETLTPRTGIEVRGRPEDTAGGVVAPRTRRDLMKWTLFGSLLAIVGGGAVAFLQYFNPSQVGKFGSKIQVQGTLADFPVGTVFRVREGKFYLSHVPDGLLALYWKCKHLGCTVPWKPDEDYQGNQGIFHCPCHGSIYLRTGQNVAGPAPQPLDYFPIDISGGKITVDTGKPQTRVQYEPSQATKV